MIGSSSFLCCDRELFPLVEGAGQIFLMNGVSADNSDSSTSGKYDDFMATLTPTQEHSGTPMCQTRLIIPWIVPLITISQVSSSPKSAARSSSSPRSFKIKFPVSTDVSLIDLHMKSIDIRNIVRIKVRKDETDTPPTHAPSLADALFQMTAVRCVETLPNLCVVEKKKIEPTLSTHLQSKLTLSLHERKYRRKHFLVISKSILLYSCCKTGIELGTEVAIATDSLAKFTSQPFPNLFLFSCAI